ncbi:putative Calmodulin-lysine N-methyltransferase [Hypsibius exemplaris]|uniref:Calmodulin-lysine N-methyltransferase n=1 Tax=Hypsibius exemplaris TaxID=2072580 RepID=A0A1W0WJX7_HYPEX|nr:putative Calmodulin-lysine N-methyltransferase [Hypsibius exemplaris]
MSAGLARMRWKILSQAIVPKSTDSGTLLVEANCDGAENSSRNLVLGSTCVLGSRGVASTRRFADFGLFDQTPDPNVEGNSGAFFHFPSCSALTFSSYSTSLKDDHVEGDDQASSPLEPSILSVFISSPVRSHTIADIKGFDNTGNICIWPSEQVLAYICAQTVGRFSGKRVCELGGGMTCLAANFIAGGVDAEAVLLTDGNARSIENCRRIQSCNMEKRLYKTHNVGVRVLRWDRPNDYEDLDPFDYVIAADCLFVTDFHEALANCVLQLLKKSVSFPKSYCLQGVALIVAPARGKTLNEFVAKAQSRFTVDVSHRYDETIWRRHQHLLKSNADYILDLHYPLLVTLRKKKSFKSFNFSSGVGDTDMAFPKDNSPKHYPATPIRPLNSQSRSPFLTFASPFSILNCLSERRFFMGVPKKTCPSKKRFHTSRHVRLSKPNNLPRRPLTHSTYKQGKQLYHEPYRLPPSHFLIHCAKKGSCAKKASCAWPFGNNDVDVEDLPMDRKKNTAVSVFVFLPYAYQYLISKYWTTKGSTYYLQKTFSSLDEKLQLREWLDTTWPDRWLDCARKFIFDYRGFAQEREERDDRRRPNLGDEDWDQMLESLETSDEGTGLGSNSNNAQGKSVVKKNEDAYDPSIHFGTSKEPRSPRHPEAVFHVGQVVMNKKRGYRGVVIGWDSRPIVPKNLQRHMFPKGQPNLLEQPWYAILIDTRDRLLPQMDYVPQKDIEMLFNSVIVHPVIHEYFEIRPLVNGLYRMRPFLKSVYPED